MAGFIRTVFAVLGLGLALAVAPLQGNEPSCCSTDCVEAACDAPCQGGCDWQECDCCDGCSCDMSGWYGHVGAIFLTRDKSRAGSIIASNDAAGTPFLTGQNFDFDDRAGVDATIARRLFNGDAIEARYFSVDDVFADNTIVTPGNFIGVGFTGPAGTTARSSYWTQLKSFELDYKYSVSDRLSILGGFRYLQLNDTLRTVLNANVATGLYEYENELYGGQLGADLLLTDPCNALELRVVGKAGYYHNNYEGGIQEFAGNNPIGSFLGTGECTPFVGDLVFSGSYWLSEHIALRAGYQFLWVGDVALAGEEASRSLLNPSLLRTPEHDGDLFMHGALVGMEFQW